MNILVVDDDRFILRFLKTGLQQFGHRVVACDNVSEAIAHLQRLGFDHVITDLNIGRDSGLDLVRAIETLTSSVSVTLITGDATEESEVFCESHGVKLVRKPCQLDDLLR